MSPETCELTVDCKIEFEALGEPCHSDQVGQRYTLCLPDDFRVQSIETDLPAPSRSDSRPPRLEMRHWGPWTLIDLPPELPLENGRATLTLRYRGRPEDYSFEEDRYWARATPEAVWVPRNYQWLPLLVGAPVDWPGGADFYVVITVPSDWKVLIPGSTPAVVTKVEDRTTFRFDHLGGSDGAIPWSWVAGPYELAGTGTAAGVSYSVWALPDWAEQAQALVDELGPILEYEEEVLGPLLGYPLTVIQVPPEQGGGEAFGPYGLIVASEGSRGRYGSTGDHRKLWVHETTHCLNPYFDEGLVEFVAINYLHERDPQEFSASIQSQNRYFVEAVELHGDRPINEAVAEDRVGRKVPEYHAFLYAKPALVWNMFRAVFGDKTLVNLLRTLHRRAWLYDWWTAPPTTWEDFVRDTVAEVAGQAGVDFYDRWFNQAYPLDISVRDAWVWPIPESGEWHLTFIVEDLHADDQPAARETVPAVPVSVVLDKGGELSPFELRVPLTDDRVRVSTTCPARPVRVILDPERGLLDYDPSNGFLAEGDIICLLEDESSYQVWGPPTLEHGAQFVAGALPEISSELSEFLAPLQEDDLSIVLSWTVPGYVPDRPASRVVFVEPPGEEVSTDEYERRLLRNVAENLAFSYTRSGGLAAYLADLALSGGDREALARALALRRDEFLRWNRDRPVYEVLTAGPGRWGAAYRDAIIEDKAALIWRMFHVRFGEEALREVVHEVVARSAPALAGGGGALHDAVQNPGQLLTFLRDSVQSTAGPEGQSFFDRWFYQAVALDLALERVRVRPAECPPGAENHGSWWTVSASVVDHCRDSAPARDTIPWVEVGLLLGESSSQPVDQGGRWVTERFDLTADVVEVEVTVPGRPVELVLDPYTALLDYDPGNNIVDLRPPPPLPERLRGWLPALGLAALIWLVVLVVRRRPVVQRVAMLGQDVPQVAMSRETRIIRPALTLAYVGATAGLILSLAHWLLGPDETPMRLGAIGLTLFYLAVLAGLTLTLRKPALLSTVLSLAGPASALGPIVTWVLVGTPSAGSFFLPALVLLSALASLPRNTGEPFL